MQAYLIGIDDTDNKESRGTGFRARKIYRILFSPHEKSLNFNENKRISETIATQRKTTIPVIKYTFCNTSTIPEFSEYANTIGNEAIKMAVAGVGNPKKLSFCLLSVLNFANRIAENTGTETVRIKII